MFAYVTKWRETDWEGIERERERERERARKREREERESCTYKREAKVDERTSELLYTNHLHQIIPRDALAMWLIDTRYRGCLMQINQHGSIMIFAD